MRYLSVCSGIEAASVAWHHLGWMPVGFCEIEPFPSAVLAHRFPSIPNYGDMTQHEQWPIEPGSIDLLVGGTPCQSFSVAGLRQGLADPRGNLMLTYLAIAARLKPRWIVWENVPGVLSSNGGRDFGTFLGALGELGYGWAYRVLDAQYVRVGRWPRAVPQRRRRVFVVGCLGDWTAAAEVLALREGLQRHLEASGKARQGAAADAEGGVGGGCCGTVSSKWAKGTGGPSGDECYNLIAQPPTVGTLCACNAKGVNNQYVQDGYVIAQPTEVSGTIAARFGQSRNNHEECVVQPVAFSQNQREEVREVEVPGALAAEPGTHQQTYIAQPVPIQDGREIEKRQNGLGIGRPNDPAYTVDTTGAQAIAIQGNLVGRETGGPQGVGASTDGAMYTLTKADTHAVAFQQNQLGEVRCNTVAGTVNTNSNASGRNTPMVAIGTDCYNGAITGDVAATMGTPGSSVNASGPTVMQAVAFKTGNSAKARSNAESSEVTPTLGSDAGGNTIPAVAFTDAGQGQRIRTVDESSETLRATKRGPFTDYYQDMTGRGTPLLPVAPSLTATNDPSRSPQSSEVTQQVAAVHASTMTVRRLSPRECERLQGFPDNWTAIPWRKKPADECPDGPRYKALGNSMACNCMAWIGERINNINTKETT